MNLSDQPLIMFPFKKARKEVVFKHLKNIPTYIEVKTIVFVFTSPLLSPKLIVNRLELSLLKLITTYTNQCQQHSPPEITQILFTDPRTSLK